MGSGGVKRRAGRRLRGERGAVAVEAALITPLFLLLVFGIIEFGFVFKDWQGVTSAVRAGARLASAEPRSANFAQDAANQVQGASAAVDLPEVTALWVYKADGQGYPIGSGDSFSSCNTDCVKFTWSSSQNQFVPDNLNNWPAASQDACEGEQDSVGVYMAMNHSGITGMFFNYMPLTSHTVMMLEPIPSLQGCK